jgi:hypothetical protein
MDFGNSIRSYPEARFEHFQLTACDDGKSPDLAETRVQVGRRKFWREFERHCGITVVFQAF